MKKTFSENKKQAACVNRRFETQLVRKWKCWDRERQSKSYLRLKGREEQQRKNKELML